MHIIIVYPLDILWINKKLYMYRKCSYTLVHTLQLFKGFIHLATREAILFNPLPTLGNSLKKQKSLYKVLTRSIKPFV